MRNFIKQVLANMTSLLLVGCVIVIGIIIVLSMLVKSGGSGEPTVSEKSVLVFDLSTNITDSNIGNNLAKMIRNGAFGADDSKRISLSTVLDCLDKASKDNRIVGLYMHGNLDSTGYGSGLPALKEIRGALEKFKASGKTVFAYDMNFGEKEYYLTSVANTVALNPLGAIEINGFAAQPMFFANAFKKYGIGVQVTRVGKYKSAVEPFILDKMSPENREQLENCIGDIWHEFLLDIGKSRNIKPEELQQLADEKGIFLADQAKEIHLIDKVAYLDEIIGELKTLTGKAESDQTFNQINLAAYSKISRKSIGIEKESSNKIAVVYAEGDIVDGDGEDDQVGGDRLAKQLRALRQDSTIKAIVLRVNSPGGSASASEVIQREVILTQKIKPVVISMGMLAASGGYWISTYGNRIFAEPTTITGSIGVFGMLPNFEKLANEHGITWDIIKTAKHADITTITRPKTDEELALIQSFVDRIYEQFITKVSESRKLSKEKVQEIAQGRVWSGIDAKELGLVDEIGGLGDAIKSAADLAKLNQDWKVDEYPKRRTIEEKVMDLFSADDQPKRVIKYSPFTTELKQIQDAFISISTMNDPRNVYARLPFNLQIN